MPQGGIEERSFVLICVILGHQHIAGDWAGLVGGGKAMSAFHLPAVCTKAPVWNKGRIIGQKRPLQPKHVWAIRVRLEIAENIRDLAQFNMAIDCKLRGCDLVRLKVRDVFVSGHMKERASVMQSKKWTAQCATWGSSLRACLRFRRVSRCRPKAYRDRPLRCPKFGSIYGSGAIIQHWRVAFV